MVQKKNKGITLVALVVTIIVLLILAAVSINFIIGENGIITRSKQAVVKTEVDNVKSTLSLVQNEYKLDKENGYADTNEKYLVEKGYLDDEGNVLIGNIIDNPKTGKGNKEELSDVYIYSGGNIYYYDKNGNSEVLVLTDPTGSVMGICFEEISTVGGHVLAIDSNGDLWGWGVNEYSQVCNNGEKTITMAQRIDIGKKVVKCIAAGGCSAILDENGNIWNWGKDSMGNLFRGEIDVVFDTPKQVTSGKKFVDIALSAYNFYAIDEDGKLYGCGGNRDKQLGETGGSNVTELTLLDDSRVYKQVEVGNYYLGWGLVIALDNENNAWTMGDNYIAGNGAPDNATLTFVKDNVKKIQTSGDNMHILTNNGEIWGTGCCDYGELGIGTSYLRVYTLTKIETEKSFVDIIASKGALLAKDSEGKYWACGGNEYGSLLTGTNGSELRLKECTFLNKNNVKTACLVTNQGYYIDTNGVIHSLGYNYNGQLGNGETGDIDMLEIKTLTKVYGHNENFVKVETGETNSLALDADGNVYSWGNSSSGETGLGLAAEISEPTKIPNLKVKDISSGCSLTGLLAENGDLFMCGGNYSGGLGIGKTRNELEQSIELVKVLTDVKFSKISVGQENCYALDEENNLWAWGKNLSGELGDGTKIQRTTPVPIAVGTKFKEIVAGTDRSFALDADGYLWSTGNNKFGTLATGNNISVTTLTKVSDGRQYSKIAGFYDSLVAIDTDGNAYTCGDNSEGQLGDGTYNKRNSLTQVMSGMKFKACASSWENTYLIDTEGNLWGTGDNGIAELGISSDELDGSTSFIKMSDELKFKDVSAKGNFVIALTNDGIVYACGANGFRECTRVIIPEDSFSIVKIRKN